MAEQFEKDGHKREAADVYERLILKDPSTRRIVAPQLVRLYIETRQPAKALDWARAVSADMPEPQAYMAGVYAQLGGYNEARSILNREIETVQNVNRKVALLWQMADLCNRTGDVKGAHRALETAVEISAGHPEFATAKRRLSVFESRHSTDLNNLSPQPGQDAGGGK